MTTATKITYTSAAGDLDQFHRLFEEALDRVRAAAGATYPNMIGGEPAGNAGDPLDDRSPIDTSFLLGRFLTAGPAEVDLAVRRAREAQRSWARLPWQERIGILRRAAELIRERKYDLAALMSLEVGKNRLEAMGDAEESADLIDYYCEQVEEADGFVRPMGRITAVERNTDVLRPYGVFTCIAPFNFPLALSTGMSSAAIMAGNAVVYKHGLRAALVPVVTIFGIEFGTLLAGTIFTETIFDIEGIGLWALQAVSQRDLPVVSATALFGAAVLIISNILVDIVYSILDPRVRLS